MSRPRVLLIDDDDTVRSTLSDVLDEAEFEVVEAGNGREGLDMFLANPTDVLITDILMPEMEGLETIAAIRKASPEAKILAISGGGHTRDLQFLEMSRQLGAGVVLAKPFLPEDLVDAVVALLKPAVDEKGRGGRKAS